MGLHTDAYTQQLLHEALVVGAATVAMQTVLSGVPLPLMNNKYRPQVLLFLTGALLHLSAEASGVNTWYANNGAAVLRAIQIYDRVRDAAPAGPTPLNNCVYRL